MLVELLEYDIDSDLWQWQFYFVLYFVLTSLSVHLLSVEHHPQLCLL